MLPRSQGEKSTILLSPKDPKTLKILLGVFLLILVVLAGEAIFYFRAHEKERNEELETQIAPKTTASPSNLTFNSPVEKELLETIPDFARGSTHLVFFLPEESPVYPIFAGKVTNVGQKLQENGELEFVNIVIKEEEGDYLVSYLIFGEAVVEQGSEVSEKTMIAKTKAGKGPGCLSGGNLGVYLFANDQPVDLTSEMLR